MNRSTLSAAVLAACLSALLAATVSPAAAGERASAPKGFVDGAAFRELAGDDGELVEVNLTPPLLQALASSQRAAPEVGGILKDLHSITAYIFDAAGRDDTLDRAQRLVRDMEATLRRDGWSPLATVREGRSRLNVLVWSDAEKVHGLVVLAVDPDEGEVVFVNIAGIIDLARLGALSSVVDIPGLDAAAGVGGKGPDVE